MNKIKMFLPFLFIAAAIVLAQAESSNLFRIERNKNANIVVYDAVLSADGTIDKKKPVDAYWILNAKDGKRYELGAFDK
ncbi:MAG: DUF4833 domain-containing protein, partial [Elusimicrobiota bacterium]|nr:DUF4833 domain-containing protein [Elusimicrobiota bacterium]